MIRVSKKLLLSENPCDVPAGEGDVSSIHLVVGQSGQCFAGMPVSEDSGVGGGFIRPRAVFPVAVVTIGIAHLPGLVIRERLVVIRVVQSRSHLIAGAGACEHVKTCNVARIKNAQVSVVGGDIHCLSGRGASSVSEKSISGEPVGPCAHNRCDKVRTSWERHMK